MMLRTFLILSLFLPGLVSADENAVVLPTISADQTTLEDHLWLARPLVVFADAPVDPRFGEQVELLAANVEALTDRDVIVITDTDPRAMTDIRRDLRPRGFMIALLAKDGTVVLRKPFPWDVREISRAIDKLPLRKQELKIGRTVTE